MMPRSDHVIAKKGGHDIQHTLPHLVLREIAKVVDAVREGRETLRFCWWRIVGNHGPPGEPGE